MPEIPPSPFRVLVVEDDRNTRSTLTLCLEAMGCEVVTATSHATAMAALSTRALDLAFLDVKLADGNGLDLIPEIHGERPTLDVVMLSGQATFDVAVEAIRRGARDYVPKPFTPAQIRLAVERAQERIRLERELVDLRFRVAEGSGGGLLSTESPRMRAVLDVVARAARFEAAVLFRGENGTGKTELARALHALSLRRERPFVVINCPTLSEELLTSELFGHAMGAFTGAVRDNVGRVEAANGGTLFLDEIGEIPGSLQAKLLRFLQEKSFERVGETKTRTADVRIVAATNRDIRAAVRDGGFREDLLYRLNTIEVEVPPLRDRPEDILPLARLFANQFAHAAKRPSPRLSPEAERALLNYRWPGNIRELRNALERAMIFVAGDLIDRDAFADNIAGAPDKGPLLGGDYSIEEIEREHIRRVIAKSSTIERAAKTLGLDVSTIWRKRKKWDHP
jgi:NtrC-family two-component system response regulator AlgB